MRFPRASGVLLHPTSLPGPTGIGELGPAAFQFIDFLAEAGQTLWQVLPLAPTGYGNSPYSSYSAFAGNPLLISLERWVEEGLLSPADLSPAKEFSTARVDFDAVVKYRDEVLNRGFQNFRREASTEHRQAFRAWCSHPRNADWLEDYALFMALKRVTGGKPWLEWEPGIAHRDPGTLRHVYGQIEEEVWFQRFLQWQFYLHWKAMHAYARRRGIEIVGDIPIYVTDDSADVWANRELFHLDPHGKMIAVAGVPPDYFSETGQLWGNPLYRWDVLRATGYAWWIERVRVNLERFDRLRIDHFRGFEAYWEVPAGEKTAINGRWVTGPGHDLFRAIRDALGVLPIIAEDLGIITKEVEQLRDHFQFPGMKILQFAFSDDPKNLYLPHNYDHNCVVYTGTHDNDTTRGWFEQLEPERKQEILGYLGTSGERVVWDLIRLAERSVADTCIVPLQDVLELGSADRMNTPGKEEGNWDWRYQEGALTADLASRLRDMAERYGRVERRPKPPAGATTTGETEPA